MQVIISGRVTEIKPIESRDHDGKTYQKQIFAVEEINQQYPNHYGIEANGDRIGLISTLKVGDVINVTANVESRMWFSPNKNENLYFTTIKAFRIEKVQSATPTVPPTATAPEIPVTNQSVDDDLPF